jgi:hypothetical protein
MLQLFQALWTDESGQDLAEYALLIALIALVVIIAVAIECIQHDRFDPGSPGAGYFLIGFKERMGRRCRRRLPARSCPGPLECGPSDPSMASAGRTGCSSCFRRSGRMSPGRTSLSTRC